ncbi:uncharacterized protein TA13270 [Theileria annulata]|uniref:Ubiquinol-cytochrome c chaperone domain-containing protein n=1 Tax=Theileria annulata TaxID=5874 RepID=Q4UEF8_THEAN|nr:uncharacterized protein TA13270 [Theileria annulata]CAI74531.1 hypothetical protein, conserved [Theileria annulata]|eukprot:XP_952263.1 hypothetical protein, conserved [Theileria annulata]
MYFVKYSSNFLISRCSFSNSIISTNINCRTLSYYRNFVEFKPRNLFNPPVYLCKSNVVSFYSTRSDKLEKSSNLNHIPNLSSTESDKIETPDDSKPYFVQFDSKALTFDPNHALEYTNRILDDPISDISVSETSKFLLPFPNCDLPRFLEVLTRPFRESYLYEPASTMVHLCVERLENDRLTEIFDIGDGYNKRAYFLTLHVWILYRRAMIEIPEGILLKNYLLEIFYEVFRHWLRRRKVPEYLFTREYYNTQNHMIKFLLELDKSTEDEDLYPFRLSETIRVLMYENDVSQQTLDLLVKYLLRQFFHLFNIDKRYFINAMFLWADVEPICKPARLLKRPMLQLIKYGGYRGVDVKKIESQDKKKLT